jgi:hypothetical protein
MKSFHIKVALILYISSLLISSCASLKNNSKPTVPISIRIEADEHQLQNVNWNVYGLKVIRQLESFNAVSLERAEEDSATIQVSINIDRFNAFPPDERVSQRVFRRNIQAGTNAEGKPIYQTVTATASVVQSTIRTSAVFNTKLIIKGTPGKTFNQRFNETINIRNVYVRNLQGDQRALDASIYSLTTPPDAVHVDDVLLALSNQQMLERISREIRSYYSK